jgi:probable phosphoglycerate mutase
MRILIIRHGDPDYAVDNLTPKGRIEAELLSRKLAEEKLDKIYCSPLGRTRATADPTVAKTGMQPEILNWLTEFPAGLDVEKEYGLHGIDPKYKTSCPWNVLPQYWTVQEQYYDRKNWRYHTVMANSKIPAVYDNIGAEFDKLLQKHGYTRRGQLYDIAADAVETDETQTIALFCHLGLGLALVSHITALPLPVIWESFFLPTTSVTTVFAEKHQPYTTQAVLRIIGLGDVSHLYKFGEPTSSSGLQNVIS